MRFSFLTLFGHEDSSQHNPYCQARSVAWPVIAACGLFRGRFAPPRVDMTLLAIFQSGCARNVELEGAS